MDTPTNSVPEPAASDRRRRPRRGGNPAPVYVHGLDGERLLPGHVLDRSVGGLRLAVPKPVPVGAVLRVRAWHAPEDAPWAAAQVRWIQESVGRWELGCAFTEALPLRTLLLFG